MSMFMTPQQRQLHIEMLETQITKRMNEMTELQRKIKEYVDILSVPLSPQLDGLSILSLASGNVQCGRNFVALREKQEEISIFFAQYREVMADVGAINEVRNARAEAPAAAQLRLHQQAAGQGRRLQQAQARREAQVRREQHDQVRREQVLARTEQQVLARREQQAQIRREQAQARRQQQAQVRREQQAQIRREQAQARREQQAQALREQQARVQREQQAQARREQCLLELEAEIEDESDIDISDINNIF